MERALGDYALEVIREFDSTAADTELRDLLTFDIDLNAQGLDLWQKRSAEKISPAQ